MFINEYKFIIYCYKPANDPVFNFMEQVNWVISESRQIIILSENEADFIEILFVEKHNWVKFIGAGWMQKQCIYNFLYYCTWLLFHLLILGNKINKKAASKSIIDCYCYYKYAVIYNIAFTVSRWPRPAPLAAPLHWGPARGSSCS